MREWLAGQAAAGYVDYDPATGRYSLSAEHAVALTDENSPACVLGGFQGMGAAIRATPKVLEAFRTGKGVGWHEHDPDLFLGTERFFRPGYNAHLVSEWIPALDGVKAKLEAGARVADVGCGHGASTIILAKAFPRSTFVGFDYHPPSIERARERATEAGVADRTKFEVASAKSFPGSYDLVAFFDCLHDMGDPVGAAAHVRQSLGKDGTWLLVEPRAGDHVHENLHPLGRLFYSVSTLVCTQASLSQEVGAALGAQAGEARLRDVLDQGRLHADPPGDRDAVQPGARSAALGTHSIRKLVADPLLHLCGRDVLDRRRDEPAVAEGVAQDGGAVAVRLVPRRRARSSRPPRPRARANASTSFTTSMIETPVPPNCSGL